MKVIHRGKLYSVIADSGEGLWLDDGHYVEYADPTLIVDPDDHQVEGITIWEDASEP